MPGMNNPFDPVHSLVAAIRYIDSRGGLGYLLRQNSIPGAGYSKGGLVEFARGGVAYARGGGVLARLAEGGRDEAVVPLPRGWRTMANNATEGGNARSTHGPLIETAVITKEADADRVVRELDFMLRAKGIA
jgi:SLT domain-containing protein